MTRAWTLTLLAAGCALAAAAAGTGPLLVADRDRVAPRIVIRRTPVARRSQPEGLFGTVSQVFDVVASVALAVVISVLFGYLLVRLVRALLRLARLRGTSSRGGADATAYDSGEGSDEDAATTLRRRVADELALLSTDLDAVPDAREAVIACYVRMEAALAAAGAPRAAAESPLEVLSRMLADFAVPEDDIRRLTELFTEARFSDHQVTDDMRAAARRSLSAVAAAIGVSA